MLCTITELKHKVFQKVYETYEIFEAFFGSQFVDLQHLPSDDNILDVLVNAGVVMADTSEQFELSEEQYQTIKDLFSDRKTYILVWWPTVYVKNENNKGIAIRDLYAKIKVTIQGTIPYEYCGFKLTKTTFTSEQFDSGYIHSHVPSRYGVPSFLSPCLGTGPIENTIIELKNTFDEAEWMLFCQELSLYVTVESLQGGPYIRLESVGASQRLSEFSGFTPGIDSNYYFRDPVVDKLINEFIPYYLKYGHLKFDYSEENFCCGLPYYDYIIDISNTFIDYLNKFGNKDIVSTLYGNCILVKAKVKQRMFYRTDSRNNSYSNYEGQYVLTFKGQSKLLHIESREEGEDNENVTLLAHAVAMTILEKILQVVNFRYYNEHTKLPETGSIQEGTTSAHSTICYI